MPAEMSEQLQCECVNASETGLRRKSCELPCSALLQWPEELNLGPLQIRRDGKANRAFLCNITCVSVVQRGKFKCLLNPRLSLVKSFFCCCCVLELVISVEYSSIKSYLETQNNCPEKSWGSVNLP